VSAVDALNVATRDWIRKTPSLIDTVFQADGVFARFKDRAKRFPGGTKITENIVYAGMPGGAHPAPGARFTNTQRQTTQRLQFDLKYYQVTVVVDKVTVQVLNKGPFSVFPMISQEMENAYRTLGVHMAIGLYLAGSGATYTYNVNGLAEICNDNSTSSFDGATYTNYGDLARTNGNYGSQIKGKITDIGGPISYDALESTYMDVTFGALEPRIGVTTPKAFSYIKQKFQTQQRFTESRTQTSPTVGFTSLKFNNADLMVSRYCPGSHISGTGDPVAVDFITETTRLAATPRTDYPTITGETLFWLTDEDPYLNFYMSDDEEFGMGFTGFIPDPSSDQLVGRVRLACNFTAPSPRHHHQLKGITG